MEDRTNNGSSTSPWKTLAYACSKATVSGDIIHVNAGTFTETTQSSLAVGVSIEGVGVNSIILSHVGGSSYTISLYSSTQGTDGNQHISGIKMDGNNLTAYAAIQVVARKNVKIFNCTFINFLTCGILFDGQGGGGQPSTYPTGNEFHDNTVDNCSIYTPNNDPYGEGWGLLKVSGQQDMLIYNNILTQTGRTTGSNGYCIKAIQGRNKGIKIYGNTITKNQSDSNTWDFAIEFWNTLGGIEIYNNTITAGIDFSGSLGTTTGTYSYAAWIHDNTIGPATLTDTYMFTKGIYFEEISENVIVERNHIRNVGAGVYFPLYQQNNNIKNITIRYNIFDNIGVTSGNYSGWGIFCNVAAGYQNTINGFNVYNNVFMGHTGGITPEAAVYIPASGGSMTNIVIRNNIIENFTGEPVYLASSTGFSIENNIFYNNGHSNVPVYSGSGTVQNNLTSNPLFVSTSDFHLQAGSPATGKGLAISGITTDFSGNTLKSPPSIGAYESASGTQAPVSIAPVYQSSAVQNTTPSLLEMTYDLNLNNLIVPAISSFNVLVNTVSRTVNSVAISSSKVQLTLTSAIKFGDVITVAYTKPATNQIQSPAGGQAITINAQQVANNVNTASPVYISSAIANATPTILEMTYNMTLANIVPSISAFTVLVNSVARTVNSVSVSGAKVKLSLAKRIVAGDVVVVSYTKPATNPIQTTSNGTATSISNQQVLNNCINSAPTAIITSPLTNSSFSTSANITVTASAIDTDGSVVLVEFYNGSTKLGSKSSAPYALTLNNVTAGNYSLTVTATDNLNAKTTSSSISISVVDAAHKPNQHPIVKILNPSKGIKFDKLSPVTIDAIASDPDG